MLLVDGKRLRGISNDEHITHLVELFAAEDRLVIAQSKVPEKAGEAQALPELLDTVDITGAIVSMDALYANVKDVQVVLDRGAVCIDFSISCTILLESCQRPRLEK